MTVRSTEDVVGLRLLLAPEHPPHRSTREPAAQREVIHRVELEDEPQVLVDEAQAVGHRVAEVERVAVERGRGTGVGRVVAGERLDQRRLAGAVLAHERMDLAGLDRERRVDQRARGSEGLREPADLQDRRRRRGSVAVGRVVHGSLCHVTHGRRSGLLSPR
jgi:hypothetical protein